MQALVCEVGEFKYRDSQYKAMYHDFEIMLPVLVAYIKTVKAKDKTFAKKEKRVVWTKARPAIGSKIEVEFV